MGQKNTMKPTLEYHDDTVAAASRCPALDCGSRSLTIDQRIKSAMPSRRVGFHVSRYRLDFTVPLDALIFRSIPKQWFSAVTSVG